MGNCEGADLIKPVSQTACCPAADPETCVEPVPSCSAVVPDPVTCSLEEGDGITDTDCSGLCIAARAECEVAVAACKLGTTVEGLATGLLIVIIVIIVVAIAIIVGVCKCCKVCCFKEDAAPDSNDKEQLKEQLQELQK